MNNQYKGFNDKTYTTGALEIFSHPSANGTTQWHVSGVESDSYCFYNGTPYNDEVLKKAAERMIRTKYDFIGDIEFTIRPQQP